MMIKAIIFDIGGVLSRFERDINRTRWEQRLGLPHGELEKAIFGSPIAQRGFVGQASDQQVWDDLGLRFNLSAEELKTLYHEFWQDAEWDAALLDEIRALHALYRTGVISDALPGARFEPRVLAHVNASLFDVMLFSGEEGIKKPAAQIFDKALGLLGVQRAEAVFIDDSPGIIAGARALGLHAIRFETREQVLAELKQLLIE
jgi:HAD superfamily hydrolase (TIGR01509 family)